MGPVTAVATSVAGAVSGKADNYVGLDCAECGTTHSKVSWAMWVKPGTNTETMGFCNNCAKKSTGMVNRSNADGNHVKVACERCGAVYTTVNWAEWQQNGSSTKEAGVCARHAKA